MNEQRNRFLVVLILCSVSLTFLLLSSAGVGGGSAAAREESDTSSNYSWLRIVHGANREFTDPNSIAMAADNGFVIAGVGHDYPASSGWLAKFNGFGNFEWQREYEGPENSRIEHVQAFGDGYIIAGYAGTSFIARLDELGAIIWSKAVDMQITGLRVIGDSILLVGSHGANGAIVRLGSDGSLLWQRSISQVYIFAIEQTDDGGYIIGGTDAIKAVLIKFNRFDFIVWQRSYYFGNSSNVREIEPTTDGGYLIRATRYQYGYYGQYFEPWIYKINSTGAVLWHFHYEQGAMPSISAMSATDDGGAVLLGSYNTAILNTFAMRLDANGHPAWQKTYQIVGGNSSSGAGLAAGFDSFIAAGNIDYYGDPDVYVMQFTENGSLTSCAADSSINVPRASYPITVESGSAVLEETMVSLEAISISTGGMTSSTSNVCEDGEPLNTISGKVTDWLGNPLPDVTVWAGFPTNLQTDANGNYLFESLEAGIHTIYPAEDGYHFVPESRSVIVPPGGTNQDFIGITEEDCDLETDTDGDALLDGWELCGYDHDGDGTYDVDLPAMGADPLHKDIFVEIDYMNAGPGEEKSHRPDPAAIQLIVDSFNDAPVPNPDDKTGIHLHVDYGPSSPLSWGQEETWAELSSSDGLTHLKNVSVCVENQITKKLEFQWDSFDVFKNAYFASSRAPVFHYSLWAHSLCEEWPKVSGNSRNGSWNFDLGSSDFVVSLGGYGTNPGTASQQAGTFMHELGHNLGLGHGGGDHTNHKPNYSSVMNYYYQFGGVLRNGTDLIYDYSNVDLPNLNELLLDETDGIQLPAAITQLYGAKWYCDNEIRMTSDARTVDWNCDGDDLDSLVVNQDINNDEQVNLTGHDDWVNLVYGGGAVGGLGAGEELPMQTDLVELTEEQDTLYPRIQKIYLPSITR